MIRSILILGRQPDLGIAELERLLGAETLTRLNDQAVGVSLDASDIPFSRLGGSIKLCSIISSLPTVDFQKIHNYLLRDLTKQSESLDLPDGKIHLGISVSGLVVRPDKLQAIGLSFKKSLQKRTGQSVRLVPNNDQMLSSAQIIHNKLTTKGIEVVIVCDKNTAYICRTIHEQDIESYTIRDRNRPLRDARVGMLPPKLAQVLTNIAIGALKPSKDYTILDPFCGTGVLLQEASLMGYAVYGTDLEQRMVEYTEKNLEWLQTTFPDVTVKKHIEAGDATRHSWSHKIDAVACETYLGKPFTVMPDRLVLDRTIKDCDTIIRKFLLNIYDQLPNNTELCLAIPCWQTSYSTFRHLPLIDQIEELGYNRLSLEHCKADNLIYFREDQIVARELLIIARN